ncbi:MAG: MoaD/ThiS family protein [Candidatus Bathyarchaeia archaeon]
MQLPVELFGLARRLSGEKEVTVEVSDEATLHDVVVALTKRFPAFLGSLVVPHTYELKEPYFFNYNGQRAAKSLDERPEEGDRLLLFLVDAGG